MDVWGPFKIPSAEYGYHYLIGFTHEATGYTAVYPTKRHDAEELIRTTKRYRGDMARYDLDLKILRTDNGPEMSSAAFQTYLAETLITWERTLQTPSMPLVQWDLPCRIVSGPPRKSFLFYLNGCATLINPFTPDRP